MLCQPLMYHVGGRTETTSKVPCIDRYLWTGGCKQRRGRRTVKRCKPVRTNIYIYRVGLAAADRRSPSIRACPKWRRIQTSRSLNYDTSAKGYITRIGEIVLSESTERKPRDQIIEPATNSCCSPGHLLSPGPINAKITYKYI